jgi:hypothetical protein
MDARRFAKERGLNSYFEDPIYDSMLTFLWYYSKGTATNIRIDSGAEGRTLSAAEARARPLRARIRLQSTSRFMDTGIFSYQ